VSILLLIGAVILLYLSYKAFKILMKTKRKIFAVLGVGAGLIGVNVIEFIFKL